MQRDKVAMTTSPEVYSALVVACSQGDHVSLQSILNSYSDVDLNATTDGGVTLLMHAIIGAGTEVNPSGHYLETCQLLVKYGISLESADVSNGRTAAHWATYYHRDDILSELMFAGSDMTCPDILGISPFHLTIQEEAINCLEACLKILPNEIMELADSAFRLPLHHAIAIGSLDAIQLLLGANVNVNQSQEGTGLTALHIAAQLGQGPVIELLLRKGAQLDTLDVSGLTPLHIAATSESVESGLGAIVKVVGSSVLDIRDQNGMTLLMQAAAFGSEHNLKYLIKKKVDVTTVDSLEGKTALHWATGSATPTSVSCVETLLKKQRSLLEATDSYGRTPLSTCAVSGTSETLQVLVESGCNLTTVDNEQRSPLHWATVSGNYDIIPSLIEVGCPLDSADSAGATAIHYAVQHTAEPYPELLDPEEYETLLDQSRNIQACLAVLIEGGAKVGVVDNEGNTPLHYAIQYHNNIAASSALLMKGADPLINDANGMTAFHVASFRGVVDGCELLLEHSGGVHANDPDVSGRSPLMLAVMSGSVECVARLCEYGLDIDQSDAENRTALHVAAQQGSLDIVQLLHSYSAELSTSSISGPHPLHEAAANGHSDILEYLLSAGCPVNQLAGDSEATPLHYAVAGGHMICVQVLMDYNASINALAISEQGDQATPLDYCSEGHAELIDLLHSLGAQHAIQQEEAGLEEEPHVVNEGDNPVIIEDTQISDAVSIRSLKLSRPTTPIPKFDPPVPMSDSGMELPIPALKKANLIERALTVKPHPQQASIVHSTVGLYAAHATLLTAMLIGTPIGKQAVEIAHKVAMDTTEELMRASESHDSHTLPDLLWLREESPPTPSLHTPISEAPPTPATPTPPPVEIHIDPYERRLRKAIAQLDKTKSPGYLAVEELVRAQDTHMRLKRQFQTDRLKDNLIAMRDEFMYSETKEREASNRASKRLADRMNKAEQQSQEMSTAIEEQLSLARNENDKLSSLMGEMGISPRPTVAQWIKAKDGQKKAGLQSSLINWDRTRDERTTAIVLQQTLTSQRALKHAAWGAKKDISDRIKKLRDAYEPKPRPLTNKPRPVLSSVKTPEHKIKLRNSKTPTTSTVRATPTGFYKMTTPTTDHTPSQQLYSIGTDYIQSGRPPSHTYLRATGPKTIHAERTLHFVHPKQYKEPSQHNNGLLSQHSRATSVIVTNTNFDIKVKKRRASYNGPVYTSHVSPLPWKPSSNQTPVLPMNVLDPQTMSPKVATYA